MNSSQADTAQTSQPTPLPRPGKHWSLAEIALITEKSLTDDEIARRTGRSIPAVAAQRRRYTQKRAKQLGLYPYHRESLIQDKYPFAVLQLLPVPEPDRTRDI